MNQRFLARGDDIQPMKSLGKALSVMDLLVKNGRDMSVTEISAQLELPKGTVHRILATLIEFKYARKDPDTRKYGLGIRFFDIESSMDKNEALRAVITPAMRDLYLKCKETVSAASLVDQEIEYIQRFESEMLLRVAISVGTRFPAHCAATGKVLLSALSPEELKRLYKGRSKIKKLTEASMGTMKELKQTLEEVRRRGMAQDHEEALIGVNCLAAPVFNLKGELLIAISISGPRDRMTPEKMEEMTPLLQEATEHMSLELGAEANTPWPGQGGQLEPSPESSKLPGEKL